MTKKHDKKLSFRGKKPNFFRIFSGILPLLSFYVVDLSAQNIFSPLRRAPCISGIDYLSMLEIYMSRSTCMLEENFEEKKICRKMQNEIHGKFLRNLQLAVLNVLYVEGKGWRRFKENRDLLRRWVAGKGYKEQKLFLPELRAYFR